MVEIQALGQGVRCGAPYQGHSVEAWTKVTGQKFLKLTQPHSNCCHEPPDLNWPVLLAC